MLIDLHKNIIEEINKSEDYELSYFYGDWVQYANYLTNELKKKSSEQNRFPGLFLITEYREEENIYTDENTVPNCTVILINKSTKTNNEDRYDEEISYLNEIKKRYIEELNVQTINFSYDFELKFNAALETNNVTNQIRINLRDLTYELINCTI